MILRAFLRDPTEQLTGTRLHVPVSAACAFLLVLGPQGMAVYGALLEWLVRSLTHCLPPQPLLHQLPLPPALRLRDPTCLKSSSAETIVNVSTTIRLLSSYCESLPMPLRLLHPPLAAIAMWMGLDVLVGSTSPNH